MASIRERPRKDGTVAYSVLYTLDGRQTSLPFDDEKAAEAFKAAVDAHGAARACEIYGIDPRPRRHDGGLTVADYLTRYVKHLTGVEKGTAARYSAYVANDIGPILGHLPLASLKREHIATWVIAMHEAGASGKTIRNKHGFLAGAMNAAVSDGMIRTNPCDGNRLPRWDREEMTFLEGDEFKILLAAVPTYWRPLVEFLVASGARWSEATALKPPAIDVTAGTVRITKAWKTGAGGYTLGVPKTKMGVRTINVPPKVLGQLDLTGEWVFTNSGRGRAGNTGPVRIHSFNPNVWAPAVARAQEAGLRKKPRIHDLRHTCASWLIAAGRPLPAVQQHLGHESITTTVGVYGHLDRSSGQGNADAIADMLE